MKLILARITSKTGQPYGDRAQKGVVTTSLLAEKALKTRRGHERVEFGLRVTPLALDERIMALPVDSATSESASEEGEEDHHRDGRAYKLANKICLELEECEREWLQVTVGTNVGIAPVEAVRS